MRRYWVLLSVISLLFAGTAAATVQQGDVELDALAGYFSENGADGGGDVSSFFVSAAVGYFLTDNVQVSGVATGAWNSLGDVDINVYAFGARGRYHFMPQNQVVPFIGAQVLWASAEPDVGGDIDGILWGPEVGARMSLNQVTDVYGVIQYHLWDGDISDAFDDGWGIFFGLVHKFK